jgi:hypothetical protein
MQVIIKMGSVSAKVIDNEGETVLDYKVENYELDASIEKLGTAVFALLDNLRSTLEKHHD